LSFFDTKNQDFFEYVTGLVANKALKFERVIRYASFPDLQFSPRDLNVDYRRDHDEVALVLNWLKDRKEGFVDKIGELNVLDRLHTPHDDEVITKYVESFQVKHLDWRKLDLYVGEFEHNSTLETLHLYSSGNKAVISHWLSDSDGLERLEAVSITTPCALPIAKFSSVIYHTHTRCHRK